MIWWTNYVASDITQRCAPGLTSTLSRQLPVPTKDEALGLRIREHPNHRCGENPYHISTTVCVELCLWTKDFKDAPFALALYNARNHLIGKSLLEAGDVRIT